MYEKSKTSYIKDKIPSMNRIEALFRAKSQNVLSIYFTAGYPSLNDTLRIIRELDKNKADMIEVGMPFSDPIADGPVIQASSQKAIFNGMTVKLLFEQLKNVRKITDIPILLMGYLNPVLKFGLENFLKKCMETGIDGVIIPDLPVEEYQESFQAQFDNYGIDNIFLITPQTPDERISSLDNLAKGFLYMVSTAATTGAVEKFNAEQLSYFKRINDLNFKTPRLIGFGISNHVTFSQACDYSNGAIAGSAFIKALEGDGPMPENVERLIRFIREVI